MSDLKKWLSANSLGKREAALKSCGVNSVDALFNFPEDMFRELAGFTEKELAVFIAAKRKERPAVAVAAKASKEAEKIFDDIARGNPCVTDEQLLALFTALGIDPESVLVYVFVYECECKEPWKVSRDEYLSAMAKLANPATAAKMTSALQARLDNLQSPSAFSQFFTWVFSFCRRSTNTTEIPRDDALPHIRLLLSGFRVQSPFTQPLLVHLEASRSISRDLWSQLPKFLSTMKPDLSNYDDSFWNSALDDFVEAHKAPK